MNRGVFFILAFLLLMQSSFVLSAPQDIELIMQKLQGTEPQPPDPRTVQQLYEGLIESEKSQLLTRVVDSSQTRQLWDQITTQQNRRDLIGAGLLDQKSRELLQVWDTISDEHQFIIQKMDEVSESEDQKRMGFDSYMEEYILRQDGSQVTFEWKDLQQYFLEYQPQSAEPEHIIVNYNDGTRLFLPLTQFPDGLSKIRVNLTSLHYETMSGGILDIFVDDVYPTIGESQQRWSVVGFKDLAQNLYDVLVDFSSTGQGKIGISEGTIHVESQASVFIDDLRSTSYSLFDAEYEKSSFVTIHDDGLYVFRGIINTVFSSYGGSYNITETTVDDTGVLTDLRGATNARVPIFSKKYLAFNRDPLFSDTPLLEGNFDLVVAREILFNTRGVSYNLRTISGDSYSGFIVSSNALLLSQGIIYSQRVIPGVSSVYTGYTRIGSTLVDVTGMRGSENGGRDFVDFFSDILFLVDRYFGVVIRRTILSSDGYFS